MIKNSQELNKCLCKVMFMLKIIIIQRNSLFIFVFIKPQKYLINVIINRDHLNLYYHYLFMIKCKEFV